MIPSLPEGMADHDILDFYDKLSGNLTDQSTIHVHWWTHRQNASVCWICDMVTLISKILDIAQARNTKSILDIETQYSSDEDSDSEIETDYNDNRDDEQPSTVPEYEVEDNDDSTTNGEPE